jgi:hypothetical protein
MMHDDVVTVALASSKFWPVAIGFFGLSTGYLVAGGQALFQVPATSPAVEKTVAMWCVWMSGFMQLITGVYLIIGLTWFNVFGNAAPLYMAALAFTAFGAHWFAVAHRRYHGGDARPEGWMTIAFTLLSILGVLVFYSAGDIPVMLVFIGLTLVYLTEIPTRFCALAGGARLIGLWQLLTGMWLMYLTYGVVLDFAVGGHWWV